MKFRYSPRIPDTRTLPHIAGKDAPQQDAFDLQAEREFLAMRNMNSHRRVGRALVKAANTTPEE